MDFDASIILCTVNEMENLPRLVEKIEDVAKFSYQFVFVDDGSTDGTREYILDYCKNHNNAKYIFNDHKRSLLIAQYMGIKKSDGRFIIIMDSDLQHPVEKINEIYRKLNEGFDIVVASRYVKGYSQVKRDALRGVISRVALTISRIYLNSLRKTTDPLSGFVGFRKDLKYDINEKWLGYETVIFLIASNPNAKVCDVPYIFNERKNGESKIVSGFDFIRIYLTELILAKRIEVRAKKIKIQ